MAKSKSPKKRPIHKAIKDRHEQNVNESAELFRLKNDLAAERSKTKRLHEELELCEKRNVFAEAMVEHEPKRIQITAGKKTKKSNAVACIVLNDWHLEHTVDPVTVNGLNEYSVEIACRRIDRVAQKAIYLLDASRYLATIDTVVLALLGDMMDGYLRESSIQNNELSPIETGIVLENKIANVIDKILDQAKPKRLVIPCCYGNHGRNTKKMDSAATAWKNSYEWSCYTRLSLLDRFESDPRIEWQIAKGYHNVVEIEDRKIRFHHGHKIRYQGGVLGLSVPAEKSIARWDRTERVDLDVFGHHHTFTATPKFIACPSLIGMTAYSHEASYPYEPPAQTYFVFDAEHGVTETKLLFGAEPNPEPAHRDR